MTPRRTGASGRLVRIAAAPLLHFVVLGGLMFAARALIFAPEPRLVVALSETDLRDLAESWRQQTGRPPNAREHEAMVRAAVDDRLLLEEAFALGWHRTDAIAQRRLLQNQRFLAPDDPASDAEMLERAWDQGMDRSDIVVRRRLLERMRLSIFAAAREPGPTQDELAAYLAAHPDRFAHPEKVRLSHVFLSRDRRGDALRADAERLGRRLVDDALPPDEAVALADPFLVRAHLPLWPEPRIARELGGAFAAAAMRAPEGAWTGPIESAYGLHYVWVHERTPAAPASLEDAAPRVRAELLREREQDALRAHLAELRRMADVRIAEARPGDQPDDG